jgi:hypothetical protein
MNNFLSLLVKAFDEDNDVSILVEQTIERCSYITMMNGKVIDNVSQT